MDYDKELMKSSYYKRKKEAMKKTDFDTNADRAMTIVVMIALYVAFKLIV